MTEACANGVCEVPDKETTRPCPRCNGKGKRVKGVTIRYLVRGTFQSRIHDSLTYRFCPSPDCPVVYYSETGDAQFTKDELSERVTIKEKDDPLPVCYCFNFFRHDIREEIEKTGKTTVPDFISAQVKAGNCLCEYTNPQGTCCLGNVSAAVKQIQKEGKK